MAAFGFPGRKVASREREGVFLAVLLPRRPIDVKCIGVKSRGTDHTFNRVTVAVLPVQELKGVLVLGVVSEVSRGAMRCDAM